MFFILNSIHGDAKRVAIYWFTSWGLNQCSHHWGAPPSMGNHHVLRHFIGFTVIGMILGGLAQEPITSYNTSYISEIMMMDGAFLLHHHLVESSVFLPSRNVDVATESLPSSILTHLHSGMDQRSHVDRFPISTTKKSKSHIARWLSGLQLWSRPFSTCLHQLVI